MRELYTAIVIDAPVSVVWAHLTDLAAYAEWNPFIQNAEGTVAEDERLQVEITPPGGSAMTFSPTVTRAVTEREFRWLGRLFVPGLFDGEHIFELTPLSPQQMRLVQREIFRGLLVPFLWKDLNTKTRQGFEAMNEALKARAEASVASDGSPMDVAG